MNKKLILAMMLLVAVAFGGCGTEKVEVGHTQETTVNSENVDNKLDETVTVVHSLGETVVPKNPKNVVVLEYGILDALDNMGVEVKGVAMGSGMPSYLSKYNDEAKYENVGSIKEVNMEKVYELEPELIIIGGRLADYYEELSKIAPTIQLGVDASDYMNSFVENMTYLGQIFDKEEAASEKITSFKVQLEEVANKAQEKQANGLIVLTNGDSFSVYGKGSRFGLIHNELGIKPVDESIAVSTHGQNASFEYIVEQNPDYLFVVDRTAVVSSEGSAKALFENDLMKKTDAYKNDRIIYLNPTIWYAAGGGMTSTQMMIDEIKVALEK